MSQSQTNSTNKNDASTIDLKKSYPDYYGQIEHETTLPATDADTVPAETVLPDQIASNFPHDLFTHQADALDVLGNGENVCVATSTSSGKTMVYALQIAANKLSNPDSKALLVYPTKALSRDQEHALNDLYADLGLDISVHVYDGDTPSDRRKRIRTTADVVITNFSGVNTYLNQHPLWDAFYENIELVAIDESHSYTGIHGMHVAWTVRRLRRVMEHYDSDPQFVLTSATIGNPNEHSKKLTGVDVTVVDNDGSPDGKRDVIFWRPPMQEPDSEDGTVVQRPADQEASNLLAYLSDTGMQTLMFTRSRKQTELNAERARNALRDLTGRETATIESYNAGHGKKSRRAVENQLKEGALDGVITTNALELGIDIGSVDAALLSGYPGTRQSFWQQLGRAGRGTSDALGIFVAQHDSIDQYILDNPDYLLGDGNIEDAVIDLQNNFVFSRHLLCASQELPLTHDDSKWFDPYRMEAGVKMWKSAGKMVGTLDGGVQYDGPPRPQQKVSMYATSDEQFDIRCADDSVSLDMEPIDRQRAYRDFHEGAIVLQKGQQYEVTEVNEQNSQPYVELQPVNVNYYTQSLSDTHISNLRSIEKRELTDKLTLHWGKGTVNIEYNGFKKKNISSNKARPTVYDIELPPIEMETQLTWVEVDEGLVNNLRSEFSNTPGLSEKEAALGGLHAIEHGLISLAPLELRMDKQDLAGLSVLHHEELEWNGAFFIYDGVDGGVGFARAIYENFDSIAARAESMIDSCECLGVEGCPACVMEHDCGSGNEPLHTDAALSLLDRFDLDEPSDSITHHA